MVRIFPIVAIVYIITHYLLPFARSTYLKHSIERRIQGWESSACQVIRGAALAEAHLAKVLTGKLTGSRILDSRGVRLGEGKKNRVFDKLQMRNSSLGKISDMKIDYLIVTASRIVLLKIIDLRYNFSGVLGSEQERYWTHVRFGRFALPYLGSLGNKGYKFANPLLLAKRYAQTIADELGQEQHVSLVPVVLLIPKVKVVDLRERQKGSRVVYLDSLDTTLADLLDEAVADGDCQELHQRILDLFNRNEWTGV